MQTRRSSGSYGSAASIRSRPRTSSSPIASAAPSQARDVLVRTLEGVAATADALIRRAEARFKWRLGVQMLGGGIAKLREFTDWENYGGAPLLGLDRPVIVTQANSGSRAFVNAIRLGAKMQRLGVISAVAEAVATSAAALGEESSS